MSGLLGLLLDELDSSVLGTAGIGGVVGDGFVRALTHRTEVEGIAAELFEGLDDGLSTLLGERVVDGVGAQVVGMALHLEAGARVLLHIVGHLLDFCHRLRLQRSLARLEKDVVGDELTRLGNGLLNGREVSGLTQVEICCTLSENHMSNTTIRISILNMELETAGSCHIRQIDDTIAINIIFESTLVERNSEMVPLSELNKFLQEIPTQIASHIACSTTTLLKAIVSINIRTARTEHLIDITQFVVIFVEIDMPTHLIYVTRLAHKLIPLKGKNIRQIRLHVLHQWRECRR